MCVCVCHHQCVGMACVAENGTRGMGDGPKWAFKHASVKTTAKNSNSNVSLLTHQDGSHHSAQHSALTKKCKIEFSQKSVLLRFVGITELAKNVIKRKV